MTKEERQDLRVSNRELRERARKLTKGHRGDGGLLSLAATAMPLLAGALPLLLEPARAAAVSALPKNVTALMGAHTDRISVAVFAVLCILAAAVLCAPLRVAREAWFIGGAEGKKRTAKRIKFWLRPKWALKAARFVLSLWVLKLFWAAVFFAPGAFLFTGTILQASAESMGMGVFFAAVGGGAVLLLLGLCFYLAMAERYALVLSILAKQPKVKLRSALALSQARMDGHCAENLGFSLSLLGWKLLSLLIVTTPLCTPYVRQAEACKRVRLLTGGVR
ncbi:MAG: hypothetical protein LBR73_09100 [Oscillospiraceae bacterium]|jgi:hypothetical protein|nr:hypothetical protein [Oscillospiraceae bacterium]